MKFAQKLQESGQDLVEYAITFPIFMLIILGIIDIGRVVYSYSALQNATREGARYAIVHPCVADGTIANVIRTRAMAVDPAAITVSPVVWGEETVQVTSRLKFTSLTPLISVFLPVDPMDGERKFIFTSSSTMQRETWASPDCGS